jgi:hypothetical protein
MRNRYEFWTWASGYKGNGWFRRVERRLDVLLPGGVVRFPEDLAGSPGWGVLSCVWSSERGAFVCQVEECGPHDHPLWSEVLERLTSLGWAPAPSPDERADQETAVEAWGGGGE